MNTIKCSITLLIILQAFWGVVAQFPKPNPPTNVVVSVLSPTSASITFTAPVANAATLNYYLVSDLSGHAYTTLPSMPAQTPLVVVGLTPGSTYRFEVTAYSTLSQASTSTLAQNAITMPSALVLFDTSASYSPSPSLIPVSSSTVCAQSFSTGAVGGSFSELSLELALIVPINTASTDTVTVSLAADSSNSVGAPIATLTLYSAQSLTGASQINVGAYYTSTFDAVTLAPNTRYWIVMSSQSTNPPTIAWVLTSSTVSTNSEFTWHNGGAVSQDGTASFAMTVTIVPSGPAPTGPVAFDNSAQSAGSVSCVASDFLCNSFQSGSGTAVTSISLSLSTTDASSPGTVGIYLFNTEATPIPSPNMCGRAIQYIQASSLTSTPTLYTYSTDYSVTPFTRYWVCLLGDGRTVVDWTQVQAGVSQTVGTFVSTEYNLVQSNSQPLEEQSSINTNANAPPFIMTVLTNAASLAGR